MKRFMFVWMAVFYLAIVTVLFGASAVNAAQTISLYVIDGGAMISNKDIGWMQTDTIGIYYVQDDRLGDPGHDLGSMLEFRLLSSNPYALFIGAQWGDHITFQDGDVNSGIILGDSYLGSNCMGHQQDVVFIGDVYILFTDPSPTPPVFTVRVVGNENGDPHLMPPGLYIDLYPCAERTTFQLVNGGTFFFNCEDCEPVAVKPMTWGAIKTLYK
jgi:hypothetical protein